MVLTIDGERQKKRKYRLKKKLLIARLNRHNQNNNNHLSTENYDAVLALISNFENCTVTEQYQIYFFYTANFQHHPRLDAYFQQKLGRQVEWAIKTMLFHVTTYKNFETLPLFGAKANNFWQELVTCDLKNPNQIHQKTWYSVNEDFRKTLAASAKDQQQYQIEIVLAFQKKKQNPISYQQGIYNNEELTLVAPFLQNALSTQIDFLKLIRIGIILSQQNYFHLNYSPEHVLADAQGNIKLCGLSWIIKKAKTRNFHFRGGSPFIAPEIYFQKEQTLIDLEKASVWSLGVLYIVLFKNLKINENSYEMYGKITSIQFQFSWKRVFSLSPGSRPTLSELEMLFIQDLKLSGYTGIKSEY